MGKSPLKDKSYDFAKRVALKEANETDYWLMLMPDMNYTNADENFVSLQDECRELVSMLVATVKTSKS